mgnify:CR=1 FL=1
MPEAAPGAAVAVIGAQLVVELAEALPREIQDAAVVLQDFIKQGDGLLLHRLAQWFEAAGEVFAPIATALSIQAEGERSAA